MQTRYAKLPATYRPYPGMNIALPRPPAIWTRAGLTAFAAIAFVALTAAQTAPAEDGTSIEAVKGRLANAQAREDLEPSYALKPGQRPR